MVPLEDFVGCKITLEIEEININIYHLYLITYMTKFFQDEVINMMKLSSHTKLKNGNLHNEEKHFYVKKITKTIP